MNHSQNNLTQQWIETHENNTQRNFPLILNWVRKCLWIKEYSWFFKDYEKYRFIFFGGRQKKKWFIYMLEIRHKICEKLTRQFESDPTFWFEFDERVPWIKMIKFGFGEFDLEHDLNQAIAWFELHKQRWILKTFIHA